MNNSENMVLNTVNVFIPDVLAQQLYCFTAIGRTPMFTIAVEGTFTIIAGKVAKSQITTVTFTI